MNREQKALVVSQAITAMIVNIYPDKLEPILKAERDAWYASQQLGMNAQIEAQANVKASINSLVNTLDEYKLEAIISRLETALGVE